jgi:hypothetical protein
MYNMCPPLFLAIIFDLGLDKFLLYPCYFIEWLIISFFIQPLALLRKPKTVIHQQCIISDINNKN